MGTRVSVSAAGPLCGRACERPAAGSESALNARGVRELGGVFEVRNLIAWCLERYGMGVRTCIQRFLCNFPPLLPREMRPVR